MTEENHQSDKTFKLVVERLEVERRLLKQLEESNNENRPESQTSISSVEFYVCEDDEVETVERKKEIETALKKRMFALKELIETEERYINDLGRIVNGYMKTIEIAKQKNKLPKNLRNGKDDLVFINIESIYKFHRDIFYPELKHCFDNPGSLGPIITRFERNFHKYIIFCQKKPFSEHIVTENAKYFHKLKQQMNHDIGLNDLLIKPVQRITRYGLILKEITKQTAVAGLNSELKSLRDARAILQRICKELNDMMQMRLLEKFPGSITNQGKLILYGPLEYIEATSNWHLTQQSKPIQAYLFEQSVIFANIVYKNGNPTYIYETHINVNKMELRRYNEQRFLLCSTDQTQKRRFFLCGSTNPAKYEEWFNAIKNLLDAIKKFQFMIQNPVEYQRQLENNS